MNIFQWTCPLKTLFGTGPLKTIGPGRPETGSPRNQINLLFGLMFLFDRSNKNISGQKQLAPAGPKPARREIKSTSFLANVFI